MVLPQIAPAASHPVVKTSKDFFVEVSIHCLPFRHKLVMDQSFLVKRVMSITLILDLDILTFFGLGDPGDFHWRLCLFVS